MRFIKIPHLPKFDVGLAAVSNQYPFILQGLMSLGIKIIPVKPRTLLEKPIQSHADVLCCPIKNQFILVARGESALKYNLEQYGFQVIESSNTVMSPYPKDSVLNVARVGDFLIGNTMALDPIILEYSSNKNLHFIRVRQGYTKCSTVVVDESSIITSDDGIERAAKKAGLHVLKIQPGYIKLPGYKYGFIGGTCGMVGNKHLAFAGDPMYHPDYAKIKSFLDRRSIKMIALVKGPLIDVGGIIPLMEKIQIKENRPTIIQNKYFV